MRFARSIGTVMPAVLLVAACSGSSTPTQPAGGGGGSTQAPAATTADGGGGGATEAPAATDAGDGGGGGGVSTQNGTMHIEISGPVTKSADYGFIPLGSIFGGQAGSALNFSGSDQNEIVSILIGADSAVTISWLSADFQAPATVCTTSNWNIGATSGSGSFDCTAAIVILASGASVANAKVTGNFTAHA